VVRRTKESGGQVKKSEAMNEVRPFIQNVHNFRDECLVDENRPPIERVALFDEAQRAWNMEQTSGFMSRKKNRANFNQSEPEYLISCPDRHPDWAVVVCLVGGGQEINTGEAGISEWIESLNRSFHDWHIFISPQLTDSEYGAKKLLEDIRSKPNVQYMSELHLSVSMRSFRAEHVSLLVKQLLDINTVAAHASLDIVRSKYPIVVTRDLNKAKKWLKHQARETERYGIVVSSQLKRSLAKEKNNPNSFGARQKNWYDSQEKVPTIPNNRVVLPSRWDLPFAVSDPAMNRRAILLRPLWGAGAFAVKAYFILSSRQNFPIFLPG
jgi:hypothetical protein